MKRYLLAVASIAALLFVSSARADAQEFSAKFSGFNEIGALNAATGAILSEGQGTLKLDLNRAAQTLDYTLTYSGLSADVTQAHIHFGKDHVAGGVIVFLCGGGGTPSCPNPGLTGGTVSGTITSANVKAIPSQNITAGDFDALEDALTSNTAYANIHTKNFPAGEIRGQIQPDRGVPFGFGF
jgi:CHRD domain-containing protein